MKPRPYQTEALDNAWRCLNVHRSTLVVLATGLGKTNVFSWFAQKWVNEGNGNVLVLAHRDELCRQAAERIELITSELCGIEKAESYADPLARFAVGSVATLKRKRLDEFMQRFAPTLIVTDEAHHGEAASYQRIYEAAPDAKLLGVTATPNRTDKLALGNTYESVACEFGIYPAVCEGWLCDVIPEQVNVKGLDFSKVRTIKRDLSEKELDAILKQEQHLHAMAKPIVELCGNDPTLVFCVSVAHAELLSNIINRYKQGACLGETAVMLCGATPQDDRRSILQKYHEGSITTICNVGVLTEGFDAPHTKNIVMARPTKSLTLYTQCVGRGTRTLPGVIDGIETATGRRNAIAASYKKHCRIIDFVGNSGKHKLVTAYDVLGGESRDEVRKAAMKARDENETVTEAVRKQDAFEEFMSETAELIDAKEKAKRQHLVGDVSYDTQRVNAFDGDYATSTNGTVKRGGASTKQVALLAAYGVDQNTAAGYSKRQAGAVIDSLKSKGQPFNHRIWRALNG